jgi:hypothetical protein
VSSENVSFNPNAEVELLPIINQKKAHSHKETVLLFYYENEKSFIALIAVKTLS